MLVTSELSLKDYRFSSKAGNGDGPGKHRHTVDALRTTCWFHELRIRTSATSLYALEKKLEPEAFGTDALGTNYRRNKWRWYALGRHTPSARLIQTMGVAHAGTQSLFDHLFWEVLRPQLSAISMAHVWLSRLSPEVARIVASPLTRNLQGGLKVVALARLERISDLDAMACVIVFLRCAIERNNYSSDVSRLAASLCRMSIVGAEFLYSHGVAGPLAEYFDELLLSRLPLPEQYEMTAPVYLSRAHLAADYVVSFECIEDVSLTLADQKGYVLDIVNGLYGKELQAKFTSQAVRESRPNIYYDKRQLNQPHR